MSSPFGSRLCSSRLERRVEHLLPHVEPLAELVGGLHPLHQLGRDRLAGLVVLGERLQRLGRPDPLLEHLRRRLDEVPLGRDARDAGPPRVAAEHVVQQVAELVEERLDVGVLHQRRLGAGLREVADQHALGQLRPALPLVSVNWAACLYLSSRGCMSR